MKTAAHAAVMQLAANYRQREGANWEMMDLMDAHVFVSSSAIWVGEGRTAPASRTCLPQPECLWGPADKTANGWLRLSSTCGRGDPFTKAAVSNPV